MEKLRKEAKSLHTKLKQISEEISGKENEIQGLRKSNAALIEQHLGKTRKPASLEQQRKQITRCDLELLELALVKKSLNEKLLLADSNIRLEKVREQIAAFETESEKQLKLFNDFQKVGDMLDRLGLEIEKLSSGNHCLHALLKLIWQNDFVKTEVDLQKVLGDWSTTMNLLLSTNFDNLQRRSMDTGQGINGLWMQLNALATGSRTIPSSKVTKTAGSQVQKIPSDHFVRTKQAAQDAVQRGKKSKYKSFIRHLPQMPPG